MEIASTRKVSIRTATRRDARQILELLQEADYVHKHADWSYPSEWLGNPGFLVCELSERGNSGKLVACLGAAADPPPAAWVRLAAVSGEFQQSGVFSRMMEQLQIQLKQDQVTELGWLPSNPGTDQWPGEMGFKIANWILTYVNYDFSMIPVSHRSITVQRALLSDMEELAELEIEAFAPLWRHSASSLKSAYRHAVCFDVARIEGRVVGFQYSTRGFEDNAVHLVRITVHPHFQRRGVGTALMNAAIRSYKTLGFKQITLNTQYDNHASHRLYEKFGFKFLGDRVPLWVMEIGQSVAWIIS